MAIYYFVQKKRDLKNPEGFKYHPTIKSFGHVTRKELIEDMVRNTSLTRKEAETGIDYLFESLPRLLEGGKTVQLGELGYFRITGSSEGSDTAIEVSADKIRRVKLKFICGRDMRERINQFPIEKFPTVTNAE